MLLSAVPRHRWTRKEMSLYSEDLMSAGAFWDDCSFGCSFIPSEPLTGTYRDKRGGQQETVAGLVDLSGE